MTDVLATWAEVDSTDDDFRWGCRTVSHRADNGPFQDNSAPGRLGHKSTTFSKFPIVIVQPTWTQVSQQIWENKTLIKYETSHVTTVTSVIHRTYRILSTLKYVYIVQIVNTKGGTFWSVDDDK